MNCRVCLREFSIAHGGIDDVDLKRHCEGERHESRGDVVECMKISAFLKKKDLSVIWSNTLYLNQEFAHLLDWKRERNCRPSLCLNTMTHFKRLRWYLLRTKGYYGSYYNDTEIDIFGSWQFLLRLAALWSHDFSMNTLWKIVTEWSFTVWPLNYTYQKNIKNNYLFKKKKEKDSTIAFGLITNKQT
jgi:hypothetical protein